MHRLIFVGSALNYLSYRETRFDLNALSICFLSAPVIFLASRANLLIFAYFLVSAYFFFVRNHTKHTHLLRMVTMVFLPVVKIYFLLYFLTRWPFSRLAAFCCLSFIVLFFAGAVLFQLKFNQEALSALALPFEVLHGTVSFANKFDRPFFEILTLNYSLLSYVQPVLHVFKKLGLQEFANTLSTIVLFINIFSSFRHCFY